MVPLFENLALVVGLFSYDGGLFWGINGDWEQLPDLHDFVVDLEESYADLRRAAERTAAPPRSGAPTHRAG